MPTAPWPGRQFRSQRFDWWCLQQQWRTPSQSPGCRRQPKLVTPPPPPLFPALLPCAFSRIFPTATFPALRELGPPLARHRLGDRCHVRMVTWCGRCMLRGAGCCILHLEWQVAWCSYMLPLLHVVCCFFFFFCMLRVAVARCTLHATCCILLLHVACLLHGSCCCELQASLKCAWWMHVVFKCRMFRVA